MLIFSLVDLSQLPDWLLFSGKFHPLVLHLPVTMVLCLFPLMLLAGRQRENKSLEKVFDYALLYTALSATLAAMFGLILAAGNEYTQDTLKWHKWLGIALALVTHGLFYCKEWILENLQKGQLILVSTIAIMLVGSHQGGSLTHGEDFFSFGETEVQLSSFPEITDTTAIYAGAIAPVIASKCASCHNDQKLKGGLNMSSFASLVKGGKTGPSWTAGDPDQSLLTERIELDPEDKKHMPPKGKAQLTAAEIILFREWIQMGAGEVLRLQQLKDTDTLKSIIYQVTNAGSKAKPVKSYSFPAASSSTISSLNTPFRRILPLAYQSPALSVKFFLKEQFKAEMLDECSSIKEQVIEVNLTGMPADDKILGKLGMFSNLEKLNLNGTSISGKTLKSLIACTYLEQVSLASTAVEPADLRTIAQMPSLRKVFLWNTKVTEKDIANLSKEYPSVGWDLGYIPDKNELLKLTPPYPANRDKSILEPGESIVLKHPLPGVKIRYTTDGSVPDSATSTLFDKPLSMKGLMRVRALATASGWIRSNVSEQTFFMRGLKMDSVRLLNEPDPKYRKFGSKALTDEIKGEAGNFGMNWLGFKDSPFKAGFYSNSPKMISQVVLSLADNTGSYIFPPTQITIKAGDGPDNLKVIGNLKPEMPTKDRSNAVIPYTVTLAPGAYKYLEIEATNIQKLPSWHRGKGEKGWVFVDEVFFY
jgi:uncharacterized membrane protein